MIAGNRPIIMETTMADPKSKPKPAKPGGQPAPATAKPGKPEQEHKAGSK